MLILGIEPSLRIYKNRVLKPIHYTSLQINKYLFWTRRVSIPLPYACKAYTLPIELQALKLKKKYICAPSLNAFPSHISVTDFTVPYIIGLFRSTVLLVMSQTRFLCATMMGCHCVVSIHIHYTTTTRLIYAPPSHISVIDFTMSRLTT